MRKRTSTLSRVVPGVSLTITRSCPARALMKVLLPVFRLPTMASFITGSSGASALSPTSCSRRSSSSVRPVWCVADTHTGGPKPRLTNAPAWPSRASLSHLLATTSTGLCCPRSCSATSTSSGWMPCWASTTNSTNSAVAMA